MTYRGYILQCLVLANLLSVIAAQSHAQDAEPDDAKENEKVDTSAPETGFGAGSFLAVPIPINDPTFGTGLVVGGGYLFKMDEGSDTSFLGGGGFGTTDDSYGFGVGGSLSFDSNRHNIFGFLGAADVNYDLYLAGQPVRIDQEGVAFQGEYRYGFTETLSAGVSFRYLESKLSGVGGSTLPPVIEDLANNSIATLGVLARWDTRDDSYYPTDGNKLDFSVTYSEEVSGLQLKYGHGTLGFDHFWSPGGRSVIALRAAGCWIEDHAPFFDSCLLGSELRGFSLFEFYGSTMLTAQAEYRGRVSDRFGYVAYGGLGEVQKNNASVDSGTRYAGGLGLRYRVSKQFALDFSVDGSINDMGETFVYFYVGQHF